MRVNLMFGLPMWLTLVVAVALFWFFVMPRLRRGGFGKGR